MVATSGTGWKLAPCLVALIEECDRLFPDRTRISDGSIGDQAHASRTSDHNPADGWVCAVDVTDDKADGCDADLLAQHLVASRDPRVKYVIWNRTIAKSYASGGVPAWQPHPYTGVNAHEKHTHVSVHNTAAARGDLSAWWPYEEDDMPLSDADLLKVADVVQKVLTPKLEQLEADVKADIKAKIADVQGNLADLQRRVLGIPEMADGTEQHKADAETGQRFQKLLDA